MPRPQTKQDLLAQSLENYEKLINFIEKLSDEEQNKDFPPGTMNRNIKDVLMHLHHWHLLTKDWYSVGMAGGKPEMPAKGYTWKTTSELNRWIWEQYKEVSLVEAKNKFKASFLELREIIESHSNEELFEKKRYKWTGSTSLGSYLVSAACSHYDWAFKLISRCKKSQILK